MILSLKQRLDRMIPDEAASSVGLGRVAFYEHLRKGKLEAAVWSRTYYSRRQPHGRFSWFHVFETALGVLLDLHGSEYLAGYLAHHHPGLSRAIVRAVVPATAFHPDSALHPDNPAYSAPLDQRVAS